MADANIELLFKLVADPSGVQKGTAVAEEELKKLRSTFDAQLSLIQGKGLEILADQITDVTQKIPLIGPAVSDVTNKFLALADQSKELVSLNESIEKIGQASGRSSIEVVSFLNSLSNLTDGTEKQEAALKFLGDNLATTLLPTLDLAARSSKAFGDEVIASATKLGKTDDEISAFANRLIQAEDRGKAFAEMVSFLGLEAATKLAPAMKAAADSIETVARVSNLPTGVVSAFVHEFSKIEGTADKNSAAVGFFGQAVAEKVGPELNKAAVAMGTAEGAAATFIASLNSIVTALGPVGVAIIAVVANLAIYAIAIKAAVDVSVALVEQFLALAKSAAEFRAKLFDLSQQTGLSVELLSALEVEAKKSGSTIEGMVAAILQFTQKIEQAKDPTSEMSDIFEQLNITSSDTEEAFKQAVTGLAAIDNASRQTALAMQLFGRSSKTIIQIIRETNGNLDEVIKKAKEFGILVSTEDAEAADKFSDALEIVNLQLRSLVGKEVIPAAIDAVEAFSATLKQHEVEIQIVRNALSLFAEVLSALVPPAISLVISMVSGLALALQALLLPAKAAYELGRLIGSGFGLIADNTEKATDATDEHTAATKALADAEKQVRQEAENRVKTGNEEIKFLDSLLDKTELTAEENKRLEDSYAKLDDAQKKQFDSTNSLSEAIVVLIGLKRQQLEIDKELAKTPEQRVKDLKEEVIELQNLTQDRVFAARVQADLAKDELKRIQDRFDAGQATEKELQDQKVKTATLVRDAELAQLLIQREVLLKRQQAEQADVSTKKAQREQTTKDLRENEIKQFDVREEFRRKIEEADAKYKADRIASDLRFNQQLTENFVRESNERIAKFQSELNTGTTIRDRLSFVDQNSITQTQLRENEKNRIFIDSEIKRADLQVEVRETLTKTLVGLQKEAFRLEKQLSDEHINNVARITTEEKIATLDKIKTEQDLQIQRRINDLDEQKRRTVNVDQRRTIDLQIKALDTEKTRVEREYSEKRRQIIQEEFEFRKSVLLQQATTTVSLIQEIENRTLESIKRQSELRVITEEEAAKRITRARLNALDAQKALVEAEQQAAQTIVDPLAREQREQELLNRLKEINAQRVRIELDGAREVDEARQEDLRNEEEYQDQLSSLYNRRLAIQRDAARAILSLLQASGARQRDIARAQIELERADEEERHRINKERLQREALLLNERIRVLEQHLKTLRATSQQNTPEFEQTTTERDRTVELLREKNLAIEAEDTRHIASRQTAIQLLNSGLFTRREIINQLEIEISNEERRHTRTIEQLKKQEEEVLKKKELGEKELQELKDINEKIEAENARHAAVTEAQKNTKTKAETPDFVQGLFDVLGESPIKKQGDALKELGKIAGDVFQGMANAIGGLVQQWVLYGNTGPAALRKVVAAALAAFASQAAVAALMELAYGFAALTPWGALLYGPAVLHFKAAALFGAAAAIAGVAGRAIAGGAFNEGGSSGGGGGSAGTNRSQQQTRQTVSPIDIQRENQSRELHIFLHAEPGGGFDDAVVRGVINNVRKNGDMRDVIVHTAER